MKHNIIEKKEYQFTYKKKLNYITNSEKNRYMGENRKKCLSASLKNNNENWFNDKIKNIPNIKYRRQSIWGYRIFDFWFHEYGCAIEIDGVEHNESYDHYRDVYNYLRSGIVVIRVRNKNESDAEEAIKLLLSLDKWKERRYKIGIKRYQKRTDITNPKDPIWTNGESIQSSLF